MSSWHNRSHGNNYTQETQDIKLAAEPGTNASCGNGITDLSFSDNNLLLASSWDNHLRCWQVAKNGNQIQANFGAKVNTNSPSLCSCITKDGAMAFSGGADNTVQMWQMGAQTTTTIGKHDQPVSSIHFVPNNNMVVSSSWDATVRFWDMRQPTETFKLQLKQKIYSMDINYPFMVVSSAETNQQGNPLLHLYSLANGAPQLFKNTHIDSTLKHQTRCVKIFNNQRQGFAVGSVEGRVEIKDINELSGARSFAFKCHRVKSPRPHNNKDMHHVYSVNCISFNSRGSFATGGSDGTFNFWDKEQKTRLKEFKAGAGCRKQQQARVAGSAGQTISACVFSANTDMFGYAMSYDWSRGDDAQLKALPNDIYLHSVVEADLTPPAKTGTGRK